MLELYASIADILVGLAAIVTATAAVLGLNTWKAQARGHLAFRLSHELLSNTYRLRDTVRALRSPYMSAAEMKDPPSDSPLDSSAAGRHFYRQFSGYNQRLLRLEDVRAGIMATLPEAEALWGHNIKVAYDALFRHVNQLVAEIR